MIKILASLLVLISTSAFSQSYGGSTYYGYPVVPMSDPYIPSGNSEPKQNLETVYYPFDGERSEVIYKDESVCIQGPVEYGNQTTNLSNDGRISYNGPKCLKGGKVETLSLVAQAGSKWWLEKRQTPVERYIHWINGIPESIERDVLTIRCFSVKQIMKAAKKSRCDFQNITISGVVIEL